MKTTVLLGGLLCLMFLCGNLRSEQSGAAKRKDPEEPVNLLSKKWQGNAISYSGYRANQSPNTGVRPSQQQVTEDLRILEKNWRIIRVYGAGRHSEDVLEVISREKIELKVMLGIWLGIEPKTERENARQVADAIRLANQYADIVVAVNVGNEILVDWTLHPVPEQKVIDYVRQVKAAISQPVTVADNYVWWRDSGARLAKEVDFITIHTYPLWERKDIDQGLSYTIQNYEGVRAAFPDKAIVIGEAGWATYTEGNLHVPRGGDERKQTRYYEELMAWSREKGLTVFVFEAFDEPWKGTGTEGHWGLFTEGRKAKPVMQKRYPELMPDGPTSPSYPDRQESPAGPDIKAMLGTDLAKVLRNGTVNPLGPGIVSAAVAATRRADDGTALKLVHNGSDWGGVYLLFDAFDASAFGSLVLRLKVNSDVANLELKLEDTNANAQVVNVIQYASPPDAAGWKTCTVPLKTFTQIDVARMSVIGLWNPRKETNAFVASEIFIQNVHLR